MNLSLNAIAAPLPALSSPNISIFQPNELVIRRCLQDRLALISRSRTHTLHFQWCDFTHRTTLCPRKGTAMSDDCLDGSDEVVNKEHPAVGHQQGQNRLNLLQAASLRFRVSSSSCCRCRCCGSSSSSMAVVVVAVVAWQQKPCMLLIWRSELELACCEFPMRSCY